MQMTLADYGLSDYTFDKLDALTDSFAEIAASYNHTDNIFTSLIPRMNEFSIVARSKILSFSLIFLFIFIVSVHRTMPFKHLESVRLKKKRISCFYSVSYQ